MGLLAEKYPVGRYNGYRCNVGGAVGGAEELKLL